MRVIESEAKLLLEAEGFPIPEGRVVCSSEDALLLARSLNRPVIVKAQVPMGGRMKSGGVKLAHTPEEAGETAAAMLGTQVCGFPVSRILVEEKLEVEREVFVAATYDAEDRTAVLLASSTGGVEVDVASDVVRRPFSTLTIAPPHLGREVASELGFRGRQLPALGDMITRLIHCFTRWDALLLEVNPLILDRDGQWWVADVHLELDDDAAYRQAGLLKSLPQSHTFALPQSEFERQASQIDAADHRGVCGRLLAFGGNLGLLIGGGGGSLTAFDAVLDAGLEPANYCEIGGNPSVSKLKELTKLILTQPGVDRLAVIMNVVSNTRVDLVARGVIKGILELGRNPSEVIAAFRIPGSWEQEGRAILRHYGIPFCGRETSIDQVVETIKWPS